MKQRAEDLRKDRTVQAAKIMNAAHTGSNNGSYKKDNRPSSVLQKKLVDAMATGNPVQRRQNNTGLPDQLKSGVEALSGQSMDDVTVHYNSDKPAQLNAYAYAQGANIHIAPGQEKHLPHEAWHVVQQKQGRVNPTMQMKGKVNINDDKGLENEADIMGAKALSQNLTGQTTGHIIQNKSFIPNRGLSLASHSAHSRKVFQFALPPNQWDTNKLYTASTGKTEVYRGGRPVKFSTAFKKGLLKKWNDGGNFGLMGSSSGNKVYIRAVSEQSATFANWVPIEAFQIDHKVPWYQISADLHKKSNLSALSKITHATVKGKPTMYAAKMYYHDFSNLRPMQGSENAGKGAKASGGAGTVTHKQLEVEKYVTRKYLSIMDSIKNGYSNGTLAAASHLDDYWFKKGSDGKKLMNKIEEETKSTSSGAPSTPLKATGGLTFTTPLKK